MGDALNMKMSAANAQSEAAMTRSDAIAAKRQALQNAYNVEIEAAQRGVIAGQNMETMRRNQVQHVANMRAAQGGSGFATGQGSKLQAEASVADMIETAISNAMLSNTIGDQNARMQANVLRRQGETAYNVGMAKAKFYDQQAKIANRAATGMLIGSGLSLLGNIGMQFYWNKNAKEASK